MAEPFVVEYRPARLRCLRHGLLALLGIGAAAAWFGSSGLVPMALWAWHARPRVGHAERVLLHSIRAARLGRWCTRASGPVGLCLEVFVDEMPAPQLAALRRYLKRVASAGDRSQHVQPV